MQEKPIRIFSDLHYGDHSSTLVEFPALEPLFEGAAELVFNGDTLDTRPGPNPEHTKRIRTEILEFLATQSLSTQLITGNHDPDISGLHSLDLAGGAVFITHGDIIFKDIVPWGRDVGLVRERLAEEFAKLSPEESQRFKQRITAYRRAAARIPQRHQAERDPWKYALSFVCDTVWPPSRAFRILNTWRKTPSYAEQLVARHRPESRFFIMGHTHRAGSWKRPSGLVVLNTGSFCHPFQAAVVDLYKDRIELRRLKRSGHSYKLADTISVHSLAASQ